MEDNLYTLAGTVHIPDEKHDEFNRRVLMVLERCGIRKTEEILLNGKEQTVLAIPKSDEDGIVAFNYSIFEKKTREISTFNIYTGELTVSDRGYNEYGLVMNLIMVLQEIYSDRPCYLMKENVPVNTNNYVRVLTDILQESIDCTIADDIWRMICFFHYSENYEDISPMDAWFASPLISMNQAVLAANLLRYPISLSEEGGLLNEESVDNAFLYLQREFIYRFFIAHKDDVSLFPWLKDLLESNCAERQKLAEEKSVYAVIARLSATLHPQIIADCYAAAIGEEFWMVWERLEIKGYTDIQIKAGFEKDTDIEPYPFYKAIWRNNEDEFIDQWTGDNLRLSEKMKLKLDSWKEAYEKAAVPDNFDMEVILSDIQSDMEHDWDCRYPDKSFFEEFLSNKDDIRYQKLLIVLRDFIDEGVVFYPELTRRQAIDWALKRARDKQDSVLMSAYQTLMVNHKQRLLIFGF